MEKNIRIALCDDCEEDNQKMGQLLSEYLDENNLCVTVDLFSSGEELLKAEISQYHLIFLDIFLDGIDGMETAKLLIQKNTRLQVVFVSTSTDFAAEAFAIDALQYIVKPVEKKSLYRLLDRFFDGMMSIRTIAVRVGRREEKIHISEILYVETKGRKTVIHMKNGSLEASLSLTEMMQLLPKGEFCMPIRWAYVSMREITEMYTDSVQLSDGTRIPVSRGKKEEVRETFKKFMWADMRRKMRGR